MLFDTVYFADTALGFNYPTEPRLTRTRRFSEFYANIHRLDYNGLKEWAIQELNEWASAQEQTDFVPVFYKLQAVPVDTIPRPIDNNENLARLKKQEIGYNIECVFTYERRVDADAGAHKRARTTALYSDIANLLHARVAQLENRLVAGGGTFDG